MKTEDAADLLIAALDQYSNPRDRDLRWSAVYSLGQRFSRHFTLGEMQKIARAASSPSTIDVIDKSWSGLKARDGKVWLA